MREENILANVRARYVDHLMRNYNLHWPRSSAELFTFLNKLKGDPDVGSYIVDVRGRGLMVGVEFVAPKDKGKGLASKVAKKCIEKGMLILTTSIHEVIRFIPPLNVTKGEMKAGCDIFVESVHEVVENST